MSSCQGRASVVEVSRVGRAGSPGVQRPPGPATHLKVGRRTQLSHSAVQAVCDAVVSLSDSAVLAVVYCPGPPCCLTHRALTARSSVLCKLPELFPPCLKYYRVTLKLYFSLTMARLPPWGHCRFHFRGLFHCLKYFNDFSWFWCKVHSSAERKTCFLSGPTPCSCLRSQGPPDSA